MSICRDNIYLCAVRNGEGCTAPVIMRMAGEDNPKTFSSVMMGLVERDLVDCKGTCPEDATFHLSEQGRRRLEEGT